ncbi:hypothetical protein F5Y04DRAFT_195465 [Hypomontagnella monticulosa]|nr:hypothetical protein F5Y04DRAFT_195465 [Hypomontagnella monticulosa]
MLNERLVCLWSSIPQAFLAAQMAWPGHTRSIAGRKTRIHASLSRTIRVRVFCKTSVTEAFSLLTPIKSDIPLDPLTFTCLSCLKHLNF